MGCFCDVVSSLDLYRPPAKPSRLGRRSSTRSRPCPPCALHTATPMKCARGSRTVASRAADGVRERAAAHARVAEFVCAACGRGRGATRRVGRRRRAEGDGALCARESWPRTRTRTCSAHGDHRGQEHLRRKQRTSRAHHDGACSRGGWRERGACGAAKREREGGLSEVWRMHKTNQELV